MRVMYGMRRRLYLNREERIISGVISGLGDYLDQDPTVLRLLWIVITVFTGFIPGLVVYLAASLIIPFRPEEVSSTRTASSSTLSS